jgi:hypothetical protein
MTDRTLLALAVAIVGLLVAIVVVAGAIVLIVNPDDLKFGTYITDLTVMASAIGAAIGVAVRALWNRQAARAVVTEHAGPAPRPPVPPQV